LSSGSQCFLSAVSPGLVLGTTGKPGGKAGGTCEEFEDNELVFLRVPVLTDPSDRR